MTNSHILRHEHFAVGIASDESTRRTALCALQILAIEAEGIFDERAVESARTCNMPMAEAEKIARTYVEKQRTDKKTTVAA